jgi:hypothetical protein
MTTSQLTYRRQVKSPDLDAITRIVKSSGFFSVAEINLVIELADEKLTAGDASSYQFLFVEDQDIVWGYSCFVLIPATAGSYDLYWLAVDAQLRNKGTDRQ